MKHRTAFALCLSVVLLTGLVVVSVTLVVMEKQDTTVLLQHIAQLKQENAALKCQINPACIQEAGQD